MYREGQWECRRSGYRRISNVGSPIRVSRNSFFFPFPPSSSTSRHQTMASCSRPMFTPLRRIFRPQAATHLRRYASQVVSRPHVNTRPDFSPLPVSFKVQASVQCQLSTRMSHNGLSSSEISTIVDSCGCNLCLCRTISPGARAHTPG